MMHKALCGLKIAWNLNYTSYWLLMMLYLCHDICDVVKKKNLYLRYGGRAGIKGL